MGNTDYNYMKPGFDVIAGGEGFSHTAAQKIVIINLSVGIGIHFWLPYNNEISIDSSLHQCIFMFYDIFRS